MQNLGVSVNGHSWWYFDENVIFPHIYSSVAKSRNIAAGLECLSELILSPRDESDGITISPDPSRKIHYYHFKLQYT